MSIAHSTPIKTHSPQASPHQAGTRSSQHALHLESLRDIIGIYGVLEADNPAARFVQERFNRIKPDIPSEELPRILVLKCDGMGVNAFAFSDGSIVLTPELIRNLEYVEELDAVVLHECRHIEGEHHRAKAAGAVVLAGEMRKHEYEADAAGFLQMAEPERDSNPHGCIKLLERLRELSPGSWDAVHGRMNERIALLRAIRNSFELGTTSNPFEDQFQKPLREIPKKLRASLRVQKSALDFLHKDLRPGDVEYNDWLVALKKSVTSTNSIPQCEIMIRHMYALRERGIIERDHDFASAESDKTKDKKRELPPTTKKFHEDLSATLSKTINKWCELRYRGIHAPPDQRDAALLRLYFEARGIFESSIGDGELRNDFCKKLGFALKNIFTQDGQKGQGEQKALASKDLPSQLFERMNVLEVIHSLRALASQRLMQGHFEREAGNGVDEKKYITYITTLCEAFAGAFASQEPSPSQDDVRAFQGDLFSTCLMFGIKEECESHERELGDAVERRWAAAIRELCGTRPHYTTSCAAVLYRLQESYDKDAGSFAEQLMYKSFRENKTLEKVLSLSQRLQNFVEQVQSKDTQDETLEKLAQEIVRDCELLPGVIVVPDTKEYGFLAGPGKRALYWLEKDEKSRLRSSPDREEEDIRRGVVLEDNTKIALLSRAVNFLCESNQRENAHLQNLIIALSQNACATNEEYKIFWSQHNLYNDISFQGRVSLYDALLKESPLIQGRLSFSPHDACHWLPGCCRADSALLDALLDLKEHVAHSGGRRGKIIVAANSYLQRWTCFVSAGPMEKSEYAAIHEKLTQACLSTSPLPEKSQDELTQLYDAAYFAPEKSFTRQIQEGILPHILQDLDFEGSLHFLFDRLPLQSCYGLTPQIFEMLESKAHLPEHYETLRTRIRDYWKANSVSSRHAAGILGIEAVGNYFRGSKKQRLLEAALQTQENDLPLRELLADVWWASSRGNVFLTMERAGILTRYGEQRDEDGDDGIGKLLSPQYMLDRLYTLGNLEKAAMVRDMLTGQAGLLHTKDGKAKLLEILSEHALEQEKEEDKVRARLLSILEAFLDAASIDEASELLTPILCDRMFRIPSTPAPWEQAFSMIVGQAFPYMNYDRDEVAEVAAAALRRVSQATYIGREERFLKKAQKKLAEAISTHPIGQEAIAQQLRACGILKEAAQAPKLTNVDLAFETGCLLDAPGVRFLQLLGQLLADLPPEYTERFRDIYDKRKGQSALSAWESIGRISPALQKSLATFGPRLGGGSLVTVFRSSLQTPEGIPEGSPEATRVMNPNALIHAQERVKLIRKTLEALVAEDPWYRSLFPVLELVDEWIVKELEDKNFVEDDKKFHATWSGWKPSWGTHAIYIPKASVEEGNGKRGAPNSKIIRYELVEDARNFTQLHELPEDERKALVATGAQFYLAQIVGQGLFGKMSESLVLSDISEGNCAVMKDGRIAIFDRGMYLHISVKEKLFLKKLLDAKTPAGQISLLAQFFSAMKENEGKREELPKILSDLMNQASQSGNIEASLFECFTELFQHGVHIPLKWNLLFKNINAWRHMGQKHGFSSLREMLEYAG